MRVNPKYCLLLALLTLVGCKSVQKEPPASNTTYKEGVFADNGEPAYITVQHCLISFREVPNVGASRTKEAAEALAQNLFEKAQAGDDFERIVERYTDDSAPGIYMMANHGFESDMRQNIFARDGMVPAFGDTGFPLKVGEFGMAPFHEKNSPFGWHIVKRIK